MHGKEGSRLCNRKGNKQQITLGFRILQRPPGQQTSSYGTPPGYSSSYTMLPANTLDSLNISLDSQKASFKDNSGSGFEITVQSTKRPDGCFITLKRLNVPRHLERFDSLWAFLHKNTEVEDWKDAAREMSAQFHKYHLDLSKMPVNLKSLSFLEEHHIRPLRNPSDSFPDAIYYCHLCHYHIASVKNAKNHLDGGDHFKDEERIRIRNDFIKGCNNLTPTFYEALNKKIDSTVLEMLETANHEGLDRLQEVRSVLNEIFRDTLTTDCHFQLDPFGPILRKCNDNHSPLKFCFDSESISLSDALETLRQLTGAVLSYQQRNGCIADACLKSSSTQIISGYLEGRRFSVYYKGYSQLKLSQLLGLYTENRSFVNNLMRLVRYWAKICSLDRSDNTRSGLPHHAFDLMVVHFLQKKDLLSIIPLSQEEHGLHFDPKTIQIQEIQERSQECISAEVPDLAKLFLQFLSHYCLNHEEVVQITRSTPVSKDETKWLRKIFHIVDPFRTENVVTFSKSFQCYFFNCFMATYVYLTVPRNKVGPISQVSLYQKLAGSSSKKKSKNDKKTRKDFGCDDTNKDASRMQDLAERFTVQDSFLVEGMTAAFLRIHKHSYKRNEPRWRKSLLHLIHEPFWTGKGFEDSLSSIEDGHSYVLSNISSSEDCEICNNELTQPLVVMHSEVPESVGTDSDCALLSKPSLEVCVQFGNETRFICEDGPMKESCGSKDLHTLSLLEVQKESDIDDIDMLTHLGPSFSNAQTNTASNPVQVYPSDFQETIPDIAVSLSQTEDRTEETTIAGINVCFEELRMRHELQGTLDDLAKNICCDWIVDDFCFDLETKENFTGGFIPEFKCSHCVMTDHALDSCPSLQLLPLVNYDSQPPTNQTNDLCKLIEMNYVYKKVSIHHLNIADDFVQQLLTRLECDKEFGKGVRLDIFGSLRNGFGIDSSDVDICLRFKDEEQPTDVPSNIMHRISRPLRSIGCRFEDIHVIPNCKVPIVKFVWWPKNNPDSKIDGDISYYNDFALANTKLLHEYSLWGNFIDDQDKRRPRVKLLGLWVKMWAKQCGIGDASSGSLSSYAYTLLMIHFLQNMGEPVLPRLQDKDFYKSEGELRAETGQYTYFYEGSEKQRNMFSKNKMNVAELFIGFLDYYSGFDFTNTVIQIRQKNVLTKLEKGWNGKMISIEDPFELEHNLGRGVSGRMAIYIQNTFRRSRDVFRSHDVYKTFFKENILEEGAEVTLNKDLSSLLEETLLNACMGEQAAPPDRICTKCKKSGHRIKACPSLNKRKPANFNRTGNETRRRNNANQRQFSRPTKVDEIIERTDKVSLQADVSSMEIYPKETQQAKLATDANSKWMNVGKITPGFCASTGF